MATTPGGSFASTGFISSWARPSDRLLAASQSDDPSIGLLLGVSDPCISVLQGEVGALRFLGSGLRCCSPWLTASGELGFGSHPLTLAASACEPSHQFFGCPSAPIASTWSSSTYIGTHVLGPFCPSSVFRLQAGGLSGVGFLASYVLFGAALIYTSL